MLPEHLRVNEEGHLVVGGCDTVDLAEQFGTPLYVMDEGLIRKICRAYKDSFAMYYGGQGTPVYASKAFCCKEMCRIVKSEGFDLEIVSGGELYTALAAGFDPAHIHFNGNNKTCEEIRYALEQKVGHILVDNIEELHLIQKFSEVMNRVTTVSLRIKPGIDAHTHQFIRTGQIDSKFGFALETGEAMQAVQETLALPNLDLEGVQCHIGSQIFDIAPFVEAAKVMLQFMQDVREKTGVTVRVLDLGGGFGIRYTDADQPVPYNDYMREVSTAIHKKCRELSFPVPYVYIEPGRSVVGEAGLTLYTVGSVKEIPGVRNYVAVDGGMTDNPRYILYQSAYDVLLANHADRAPDYTATVAGRCCESGDLIQENVKMGKPKAGDLIAVLSTGAYNYSMASNYNRVCRPPVIMVRGGSPRVVVRRESYEDLIRNDL